jgi:hypothetical protein
MHERHPRSVTPQLERRNRRRVLAADDDDIQAGIGMRIVVIVHDFGQVFAGDAEVVGQVVVAGGDDQLARGEMLLGRSKRSLNMNLKAAIFDPETRSTV